MNKTIAFDMDGTLANLYGVPGWLDALINKKPIFNKLNPMLDMKLLNTLLNKLQNQGYRVMVITWLPKKADKAYKAQCRAEKREWLSKYLPTITEIHAIQYGAPKHRATKDLEGAILFDDVEEIRNKWEKFGGVAKDETQIMETLLGLLGN